MKLPLTGIRVLDVSRALAGPYGAMFLADLGAEVIKIEPPEGEISRGFVGPSHRGESFYYLAFNRNKKSLVLDLGTPLGREALYDLVKISDVVWDNFRPGAMERLGADYETLKKLNPRIVCCSITGYGPSGPYRDRPSFDIIAQGITGVMAATGEPNGPPVKPGPPVGDMLAGIFGAMGVMAALLRRAQTGEGEKVEASLLDACVSLMGYHLSSYFCSGVVPQPTGSGVPHTSPAGAYRTQDGHVVMTAGWPRIARVLGLDWMIDDPRYRTQDLRVKNKEEVDRFVGEAFSKATNEQWLNLLETEDIPAAPVNTLDKAAVDPQILHNNMILSLQHPLGGVINLAGNPIKMTGVDEEHQPPPLLGQHNDEILVGLLGYSEERIGRLREEQERHAPELNQHLHKQL